MSWVFLSLFAAFLWALTNIIDKYVISKLVSRPILPVIVMGIIGLLASAAVFLTQGVHLLSLPNTLLAIVAGFFYVAMIFCYFYAVQAEEISRVIPLFYLSPLFISILAAIFLGEVFTPIKYVGIVLLVAGAFLISSNGAFTLKMNRAVWLMVIAAFAIAVNQVITKYLLGFADFWTVYAYIRIGAFIPLIPALALNAGHFKRLYTSSGSKPFLFMSLSELLNQVAVLLLTLAAVTGFVTLVNALSSVQPFFVLLLAVVISAFYPFILKEEAGKSKVLLKIVAIAIMFVGGLLVS